MKKNKTAMPWTGKAYKITLCGEPDCLKQPKPQELGPLALMNLGQKSGLRIPDGDTHAVFKFLTRLFPPLATLFTVENAYLSICSPKQGCGGGLTQRFFIIDRDSEPTCEDLKSVGKRIYLVPFNASFDYVPPKPPTVKCNVCDQLVDPMVMESHKEACGNGACGYEAFDENED